MLTAREELYRSCLGQDLTIEPVSSVQRWRGVIGLIWIRCSYFVELVWTRGTGLSNMLLNCLFLLALNSLRAETVFYSNSQHSARDIDAKWTVMSWLLNCTFCIWVNILAKIRAFSAVSHIIMISIYIQVKAKFVS